MPTADPIPPPAQWSGRVLDFLRNPPRRMEIFLWLLLLATIVGVRAYLVHLVPVHLWSKDAGSYSWTVFKWLQTGLWETDPRRGPIYSLIIAACLKIWGTFDSVMLLQHVLGGGAVLLAAVVLRLMHGRRAMLPIFTCGYAFAVYSLPLQLEHIIRNETLLLVFGTLALTGFFLALKRDQAGWLWLSGIATGLLTLTKNVFGPFPLAVLGLFGWQQRGTPKRAALHLACFVVATALPFIAAKIFKQLTIHDKPPEPQPGLLFFARTAQFTVLDGGIEPEIKALIRPDIDAYRALGKLDNNIVLNRTAVPRMRRAYRESGRTPSDLNKVCWRLALEAVRAHPGEYTRQVGRDFWALNLKNGTRGKSPGVNDLVSTRRVVAGMKDEPGIRREQTVHALDERMQKRHFRRYQRWVLSAWLFALSPVLLTTLGVTGLMFTTRGTDQLWWMSLAAVWWFTLVLLSTVGRPMDRYLIPVLPIMFWTLSTLVVLGWNWLFDQLAARCAPRPMAP